MGKPGGKRKVFFTKSDGAKEIKGPSSWKPGKSRNKAQQ